MDMRKLHATRRLVVSATALSLPLTCALPSYCMENIDLGSTQKESTNLATQAGTIRVGAKVQNVKAGDLLTDAQMAALMQVTNTGKQNLIIGASGNATGGRINLSTDILGGINNLVIPRGVTAINDFGASSGLSVTGSLTNGGKLIAYSSNSATVQNLINAQSLLNLQTGLISNSLAGISGISGAGKAMDLNFNVVTDFVNYGRIFSTANLNITAGGRIQNLSATQALPATLTATSGLSLAASAITNTGIIQSLQGNINFVSPVAVDLLFSNAGGAVRALNGVINFRDSNFAYKNNLNILGGDFISKALNLNSGHGTVNIDVGEVLGKLNINAGIAHVTSNTSSLHLGDIILSGDPTFYNTAGDVVVDGNLIFLGQDLAIVAGGDIYSGPIGGQISTANAAGNGGQINIVAGANFVSSGGTSSFPPAGDTLSLITITGGSTIGGTIDFTKGAKVTGLSSFANSGNAGNINIIAFAGTNPESGTIKLPSTSTVLASTGGAGGNAGNINIIAGAASKGASIQIGEVSTQLATNSVPGNIYLGTRTPDVGTGVSIQNGKILAGAFGTGAIKTASILSGDDIISSGGSVTIESGRDFAAASVAVNSTFGSAGKLSISTNSASPLLLGGTGASTNLIKTLFFSAATGNGASLSFLNSGSGGISLFVPISATGVGVGKGGSITLDATSNGGTGSLDFVGAIALNASANNGDGGSITLKSTNTISNSTAALVLSANGKGTGNGGFISISTVAANADIIAASNAPNNLILSATAASGIAGTITLNAGRDIKVSNTPSFMVIANPTVTGKGGSFSFSAGRNVSITGNINANGVVSGSGGSIFISTNSSNPFQLASVSTPVNGASSQLLAQGVGGGDGGSITIVNKGTGGINHTINTLGIVANPTGAGKGATVILDAVTGGGSGTVVLGSVVLNGNANAANGDGGFVAVRGSSIQALGAFAYTLQTNGAGTGQGGTVELTATDPSSDVLLNTTAGGGLILARGANGKGGTVIVNAGQDILVNSAALNVLPTGAGAGGDISLNAGRNVNLSAGLNADATAGDGGSITIKTNSSSTFSIASTVSPNGAAGTLSAAAAGSGNGGSISIFNRGSGGILHSNSTFFLSNQAATNGNGGSITLDALSDGGSGTVDVQVPNITVNAVGTGAKGGNITINANKLLNAPTGLTLSATGNTVGNGGKVSVQTADPSSDLLAGAVPGLIISARGGTTSGNGGEISLKAGGNLSVVTGANFLFTTASGNGAILTLEAGRNVDINAGLNVNAAGSGNGGSVKISSNSSTVFNVGAAAVNGINGTISAQAAGNGSQGSISVTNAGSGGLQLSGVILSANGAGASGTKAGTIELVGASISGSGGLQISAGTVGTGGNIFITSNDPNFDLLPGVVFGATANGGSVSGDGGTIKLNSARDIIADAGFLQVSTQVGTGGHIDLEAGRNVSVPNNNLVVSPVSSGSGGSIRIVTNSPDMFYIGNSVSPNFVSNTMLALANVTGDGGSITIINKGSGGISHENNGAYTNVKSAGASGKGGTIILDAAASGGSGPIFIGNGLAGLTLNAAGSGSGTGGKIELSASSFAIGLGDVQLNANSPAGDAGSVSITSTDPGSNIKVQPSSGFEINVTAGLNSGTVDLKAGHKISIVSSNLSTTNLNGNGANISLSAGTTGSSGTVQVFGDLLAETNAAGKNGGKIQINFRDALGTFTTGNALGASGVTGKISTTAVGGGKGGTISINNLDSSAGLDLQIKDKTLQALGSPIGTLNLQESGGPVSITVSGIASSGVLAGLNTTSSSLTYSSSADSSSLLVNNVQTTGNIQITNTGASPTINILENGSLASSAGSITFSTDILINNGNINAAGDLKASGNSSLTVSGLGNVSSAGGQIDFSTTAALQLNGSQSYSTAPGRDIHFKGTSISLNPGVTQTILSDSPTSFEASDFNFSRDSRINAIGIKTQSLVLENSAPTVTNVRVADSFSTSITSSGGDIQFFSNLGLLTFTSIAGATTGTLNLSGGPVLFNAPGTTITNKSIISSDNSLSFVLFSVITNNGTLKTSATGSSISFSAPGLATLAGTGTFSQTGAAASTLEFKTPTGFNLNAGMFYTVNGPSSSVIFDSPSINVSGAGTTATVSSTKGVTFKNSSLTPGISFSGVTNTLNISGGDVSTEDNSISIGSKFTLSQTSGKSFHFNIPASGNLTNNGSIISVAAVGLGIDIAAATDLTISGNGNYFCNNGATLGISADGKLAINGNIAASSDIQIKNSSSSDIEGSAGLIDSSLKSLTVIGGSGNVNLITNVSTLSLSGTGNFTIKNSNALTLTSISPLVSSLSLEANGGVGSLDINAAVNAGTVSLLSKGNLTIAQPISGSTSLSLGVTGALSNISGAGKVSGGDLSIKAINGTVNLSSSVKTVLLDLGTASSTTLDQSGDLSISQVSTAGALTINSIAGDDISFAANLSATNLNLTTSGTGTMSGTGLITANNLDLTLGTGSANLNTTVGTLSSNSNNAVLTINESDAIILNGVKVGSFTLTAPSVINSAPLSAGAIIVSTSVLTNNSTIASSFIDICSSTALQIAGNGVMGSGIGSVNFTANTGVLSFAGNQTFNGIANLNAVGSGQSVQIQNGVTVVGDALVNVNSPQLILQGTGTISGNPLRLNSALGAGTIANASGDVTLPANLVFEGKNLAILASGNVLASSAAKSIKLSSKTLAGGSLTIIAGYDFSPAPSPAAPGFSSQLFTLGSPSKTGGSVLLPLVTIDTSTTAAGKTGGNVTAIAHAGPTNAGTVSLGSITSSASSSGVAGSVTLIGQGGVQTGKITTTGGTAGNVSLSGALPFFSSGKVQIINGTSIGGAVIGDSIILGAGAAVYVNGPILANSTTGTGGAVRIQGDAQVEVAKNILSSGLKGGGAVNISSFESFVSVGAGGINSGGLQTTSVLGAGAAGAINIFGTGGITVLGGLIAAGGSNKGTGNGGAGAKITLSTDNTNPNLLFVNNTKVTGLIDARGGNSTGGSGGAGGNVSITTGTLQALQAGISINASAGIGGVASDGLVNIQTFASQSFPDNFNLVSTAKPFFATPGGMFTVGIGKPVNGTAGNVVSGAASVASKTNASRLVQGSGFNSAKVTIGVTGTQQNITKIIGGVPTVVPVPIDNGLGIRTAVTPSEAVALFQQSLNGVQTIVLNSSGQTETGSTITVQATQLPSVFTGFTLKAASAPTNNVLLSVVGARPSLRLPSSGVVIEGTLQFAGGSIGMLDFGSGAVNLGVGSSIQASTLILSSSNGKWTNSGTIQATNLVLAHPSNSPLVFAQNAGATITGAPGSTILLTPGYLQTYAVTFNANGANFQLPVAFGEMAVPTQYKANAQTNATQAANLRPVALAFSLRDPVNSPIAAVVQGSSQKASTFSITTLKNTIGKVTVNTPLSIADNAVLSADTTMKINSVGPLSVGNNVDLRAGVLKSTTPATGLLNPANIVKVGSISITAPSIAIGSDGSMVANGGNLSANASTGNMTMANNGLYQSNGGQISMIALGTVTGGSANNFYTRGTNVSSSLGGAIEIGSGVSKPANFTSIFNLSKGTVPSPGELGTGVVITNGNTGAVVATNDNGVLNLRSGGVNPANLNLTGGAMLFEAVGAGKAVQFDGIIMKAESLKLIGYTEQIQVRNSDSLPHNLNNETIASRDCRGDAWRRPGSVSGPATEDYGRLIAHAFTEAPDSAYALFKQDASIPKPARISFGHGNALIRLTADTTISTKFGEIKGRRGALISISMESEILRVISCSGPSHVQVLSEGLTLELPPGTEVVIGKNLGDDEIHPADGVGRRDTSNHTLPSGQKLAIQEVSLITLLANTAHMNALRKPCSGLTKMMYAQLLKTAAALQHVESGKGPFKGRMQSKQMQPKREELVPVAYR